VTGIEEYGGGGQTGGGSGQTGGGSGGESHRGRPNREHRAKRENEEDLELRLALEASKNEAEADKQRRERAAPVVDNDDDLQKAIKLSKEEEELRRRELEQTNADLLFSDAPSQPAAYQPTGNNQGYQQQGAVDWFGNLVDQNQQQQQPQNTGFLNNAYSQPTGVQPQQTGFQNGYGGYNGQQQQQQQQQYIQPQQTAFNQNNPYGQFDQFGGMGQQQQQQQQQPLQEQNTALQPGSHNPWATNKPQDSLMPQPTGSNNPFAQSFNRPQTAQPARQATLNTLHEQKTQSQFNNTNFNPPVSFSTPQPIQQQQQKPMDPHAARLNALLSAGEGQDTFGNVGNTRLPAQHTAPGTFVNSAGSGINAIHANATGNNPFLHSQFTGIPQQNRIMPAQTGPAGAFGANPYSTGNPFGGAPPQQQQQQRQPGSNNLIDL
jgi:epsin